MRATEMHDLLASCKSALEQSPVWQAGTGQFENIKYCRYCHYSFAHGHGPDCLLTRLERATSLNGGVE